MITVRGRAQRLQHLSQAVGAPAEILITMLYLDVNTTQSKGCLPTLSVNMLVGYVS